MRQELRPRIPSEYKEKLLNELDEKVSGLAPFEFFWDKGKTGRMDERAQQAAFEFAVAYGSCLFAGLEMETEPYLPAEVLGNVVLAATATLKNEATEFKKLSKSFWLLTRDKDQKAHDIFRLYLRIAAACETIRIVATLNEVRIETLSRFDEKDDTRRQHPLTHAETEALEAQQKTKPPIDHIQGRIREYLERDIMAWKGLNEAMYWKILKPFENKP